MIDTQSSAGERGSNFCRACSSINLELALDLGTSPIANNLPIFPSPAREPRYPLVFKVCTDCHLGQIAEYESASEIFSEYPYLSSTSKEWLEHARGFVESAIDKYPELSNSYVIELASNDGYLLRYFQDKGFRVLGVDPAENVAQIAEAKGIPTIPRFFGKNLAGEILNEFGTPSLIIANNVAAHVPDMIDFFSGIAKLCGADTIVSIENPSLGYLFDKFYYDTIYHEHFSYLSVDSVSRIAQKFGLILFDVEELSTHGGSLRYWLSSNQDIAINPSVNYIQKQEFARGVGNPSVIEMFSQNVLSGIHELSSWLNNQDLGSVVGYGAAAKTVTTFFAAKLDETRFEMIVDANELKQGRRLPGTDIPIFPVDRLRHTKASKVLIFPWNLEKEIISAIKGFNSEIEIWTHNPLRQL